MQAAVSVENADNSRITHLQRRPIPSVCDLDILIQVSACALDAMDLKREVQGTGEKSSGFIPGLAICGIVVKRGSSVKRLNEGDKVVAILPLDCAQGGCAEYVVANAVYATKMGEETCDEEACAILLPALRAYSALIYQIHLQRKEWLLFVPPRKGVEAIAIQLASNLGAKVIVAASGEALNFFNDCPISRVVDIEHESIIVAVQQETGGVGVDAILDYRHLFLPVCKPVANPKSRSSLDAALGQDHLGIVDHSELPQCHVTNSDLIRCMGAQARWAHCDHGSFQLDPPASRQLASRGASISFLAPEIWLLAPNRLGTFAHILVDIVSKQSSVVLKATVGLVLPLQKIKLAQRELEKTTIGTVVIKLSDPR